MSKKELRFWLQAPQTVKERGLNYRMYGDGRHYSKKKAIEILRKIRAEGKYYATTRRWRSGLGELTGQILIYVRKKSLGR